MVFEVFSYWNMKELELVFNAVAAIVGSGDYLGLMRTLAIVGLLSMAMAVLAGFAHLPDFGRWIIMLAVFNGMLLVPKVNVVLTDRTGTEPPRVVSNVPIGLAAFAHSISHIGDWLTNTFETTFSLPDDIQFRQNGTLFGHRVQQEILHAKFDNSILNSNLLEFYRECVVPEFATGYVVASDMAKSNDIWTYLSGRTNPGRLVTIRDVNNPANPPSTLGCDAAYTQISGQINTVNTRQVENMGRRLYPGLPTAQATAAIKNAIQSSTNYILGISQDAMETTKQTAMSNFMIDAQYLEPAQIGDTARAASNLAQAQAIRSTSESYKLMAKLAESTMPKIKNIVEIVQYAIFPIIMLLILMAGHKGGLVLKAYVMSLVWVQLWPPLYAIMHFVMTVHAQELAQMTNGLGLSLAEYSRLNNAYISDEAVAGMIAAVAIPAIASAIVKGGDVGVQALGGLVAPTREASTVASGMASGSFSMGSASLGSQSADNLSMGQVNTQYTYAGGEFKNKYTDQYGSVESIGNIRKIEAGGSSVTIDTTTGRMVSGNIAGFTFGGSGATATLGRHASDDNYSDSGVMAHTGQNTSLGTSVTAGLSDKQIAAFNRLFTSALNTLTSTGNEVGSGTTSTTGDTTSQSASGGVGLRNQEGADVNSKVGVHATRNFGTGSQPRLSGVEQQNPNQAQVDQAVPQAANTPAEQPSRMRKLIDALRGETPGYGLANAATGLDVKTGQQYSEEAKKIIQQASSEELKEAKAIMSKAAHQVAATTSDTGVKQAATALESSLNNATTLDAKELASLMRTDTAGRKKAMGIDNRDSVKVDNSSRLFDVAFKMYFGDGFNERQMTPEQLANFTQEWNRNPAFREEAAIKLRDEMNNEKTMIGHGVEAPKTEAEVKEGGQRDVDALNQKGKQEVTKQYRKNDGQVRAQQYTNPKSTPDLSAPAKAYAEAMKHATEEVQQAQSKIALDSGIVIAANALYQDRQRGMSTVLGNTLLGGAGSASMNDYVAALQEAAKKDPELARGLATIGLNQKHGQAATKEEIQWVIDRANGAVQKSEGTLSELNHNIEEKLHEWTFNMFKPDATPPVAR